MEFLHQLTDDVKLKIIKVGTCTVDPGRSASGQLAILKHHIGVGGGSTVVVIADGDDILLIDTGYEVETDSSAANQEYNLALLGFFLNARGYRPEAVTKVFITHFHRDHFGNIDLFPQAEWYGHRPAVESFHSPHKKRFIPLDDGAAITANIRVMHTPGHTAGHASVIYTPSNRIRIAISGDAIINLAWLQKNETWSYNSDFDDKKQAHQSMARLLDAADLIIPGHGQPFFTTPGLQKNAANTLLRYTPHSRETHGQ